MSGSFPALPTTCTWPQSFRVREVLLLIVLLPGFGCDVCLAVWVGRAGWPGCPVRTGSDRAGVVLLSCSWDCLLWSGGCGQGAEPLPAGEEGLLPGPVGADLENALTGVMCQASGDVPDPVAERVRVGFPQVLVIAEAEETGPGGEVGGDVRGDDPAAVDLPGSRRQRARGGPRRCTGGGGCPGRRRCRSPGCSCR